MKRIAWTVYFIMFFGCAALAVVGVVKDNLIYAIPFVVIAALGLLTCVMGMIWNWDPFD